MRLLRWQDFGPLAGLHREADDPAPVAQLDLADIAARHEHDLARAADRQIMPLAVADRPTDALDHLTARGKLCDAGAMVELDRSQKTGLDSHIGGRNGIAGGKPALDTIVAGGKPHDFAGFLCNGDQLSIVGPGGRIYRVEGPYCGKFEAG